MKEDYRVELFDLDKNKNFEEVEDDEVFGSDVPDKKPFDTANIVEIFKSPLYQYRIKIANQRISYLKDLAAPFQFYNKDLKSLLISIKNSMGLDEKMVDYFQYDDYERVFQKKETQ